MKLLIRTIFKILYILIYIPSIYIIGVVAMLLYSLFEWSNVKEDRKYTKIFNFYFNEWKDMALPSIKEIFDED